MRVLIDTNVILDILQKREPFFTDSYRALRRALENDAECLISASAATDIFYVLRKSLGSAQQAKEHIDQLAQVVSFADVQGMDIHTALMPLPSCGLCRILRMQWWMQWPSGAAQATSLLAISRISPVRWCQPSFPPRHS